MVFYSRHGVEPVAGLPIIAEVAREIGALTVGIITKPLLLKAPAHGQC